MALKAYNKKNLFGLGLGVVTLFNITTMSPHMMDSSMTLTTNTSYNYTSAATFIDSQGMVKTSALTELLSGDYISKEIRISDYIPRHKRTNIKLQIKKITKHISNFDFEEEYEEI